MRNSTYLVVVALLSFAVPAYAAQWPQHDPATVATAIAELDSLMNERVTELGGPGAGVALVVDGRVAHTAGFGGSDATTSVFGLASSTKLFTALVAVLLEQEGFVRLDRPLENDPLTRRAGSPTLAQLLTHTAGLSDETIGASARTPEELLALMEYLRAHLPAPAMPAGEFSSYSNVGYALAGHVLERATDQPLAELVSERVLKPLGMTHTSLEQPLPPRLRSARVATAVRAPIYFNDYPASGMMGSVADIARLHAALLTRTELFTPEIVERLTTTAHRNHPALPGLTLAFAEAEFGGVRTLRHGGNWQDYSNAGFLAPADGVALFVVFAHPDGAAVAPGAWELTLGHLRLSVDNAGLTTAPARSGGNDLGAWSGGYLRARYSRLSVAKVGILMGEVLEANLSADGAVLELWGRPLVETADRTFRRDDGLRVALRTDPMGVRYLFFGVDPYNTYRRVPSYARVMPQRLLLLAAWLSVCVCAFVWWRDHRRRRGNEREAVRGEPRRWQRRVSGSVHIGLAAYLPILVVALLLNDSWEYQYGLPFPVRGTLALGLLLPVGVVWVLFAPAPGPTARGAWVRRTVTGAVTVGYVALLLHWRLIGW